LRASINGATGEAILGITRPITDNSFTCGKTDRRWSNVYSVLGNFTGDVTIAGAAGIINTGKVTARFVLISDGTRFQGRALVAADLGGHVHINTFGAVASGAGSAHSHALGGHTAGWTLYGSRCDGSNPIRDVSGVEQYVQASPNADGSGAVWKKVYTGSHGHHHYLDGTSGGCETIAANCSPTDDESAHTHQYDKTVTPTQGPS